MARARFTANRAGIAAVGRAEFIFRELEHRATGSGSVSKPKHPRTPASTSGRSAATACRPRRRRCGSPRAPGTPPSWNLAPVRTSSSPKTKKALAWPGGRHPVQRVRHPGTPALHLLRNAAIKYGGGR